MDLLTQCVNVPAERGKLRALRNEIARDVAYREAIQKRFSPRGFALLPDVRPLEAKAEPSNGETPNGPMRTETSMAILSAAALMRKTQAGS